VCKRGLEFACLCEWESEVPGLVLSGSHFVDNNNKYEFE
jgi:hypothetical protein